MNEGDDSNSAILQLPTALIAHILEWVHFLDRLSYFSCNHSLLHSLPAYNSLLQSLSSPHPPPPILLNNHFINLQSLDVGSGASDGFLEALQSTLAVPRLKHLSLVHSLRVTDAGLESLVRNPIRCSTLETIDITYCRNTTYGGTFCLRDSLTALTLLRRQPEWMDGVYETPFENDGHHTYWADGTFSFARDSLSSGFVCDVFHWTSENENHVADKLQYNNLEALNVLPEEYRDVYRPGVSLLRLPGEEAVLVAQLLRGLYPPKDYPTMEQKRQVPVGESRYLGVDGNLLSDDSDDDDLRYVMVSHIAKKPLESLMPPSDIVERNRAAPALVAESHAGARLYRRRERNLHTILGGSQKAIDDIATHYESREILPTRR